MSKQSEAKAKQGYVPKAVQQVCGNCARYTSKKEIYQGHFGGTYTNEREMRCGLGGFAVKKMSTCNVFVLRVKA